LGFELNVSKSLDSDRWGVNAPFSQVLMAPFAVAAGILPAVEPGIVPGGMAAGVGGVIDPGGKMPPSTAGKMHAATW
jgi:hypothetical protein